MSRGARKNFGVPKSKRIFEAILRIKTVNEVDQGYWLLHSVRKGAIIKCQQRLLPV
jgi:hypothetical protein